MLFSDWHIYTYLVKKELRVLLVGVEPTTFWFVLCMLDHLIIGDLWHPGLFK